MTMLRVGRFLLPSVVAMPLAFLLGAQVEHYSEISFIATFDAMPPALHSLVTVTMIVALPILWLGSLWQRIRSYGNAEESRRLAEAKDELENDLNGWNRWCRGTFPGEQWVHEWERVAGILTVYRGNESDTVPHQLFFYVLAKADRFVKSGACSSEVQQGTACVHRLIWLAETYGLWSYLLNAETWKLVSPVLKGRMAELNKTQIGVPHFDEIALWFAYNGPPPVVSKAL